METQPSRWLELPAGTEFVRFGDLAKLIASVIKPAEPNDADGELIQAIAEGQLANDLEADVPAGALIVLNPLSEAPQTFPFGNVLAQSVVSVGTYATT